MSHAICEIVIPPTDNIEKSIGEIMDYFEKGDWWDFYVIGGRFTGHKQECSLDKAQLEKFYAILKEHKVTTSALQCGKQELSPASQIPMVDGLWREIFPGKGEQCILFAHCGDQYGRHGIYSRDICTVAEIPDQLLCSELIVAGPHWKGKGIEPKRRLSTEFWNNVEHQKTDFDGNVKAAIERIRTTDQGWRKCEIGDDWLVVTVDYHN